MTHSVTEGHSLILLQIFKNKLQANLNLYQGSKLL